MGLCGKKGTREMLAQPGVVLHKQGDEVMEGRFRQMEDTFKKEAAKILQERANLKLQQQDLVCQSFLY